MIGELRKVRTPFYDMKTRQTRVKARPCLVIGQSDSDEYVILPVSRVTAAGRVHQDYDIPLDPAVYPDLHLTSVCYVRTHKQTTAYVTSIGNRIADMKGSYEELYLDVLAKWEQFGKKVLSEAL